MRKYLSSWERHLTFISVLFYFQLLADPDGVGSQLVQFFQAAYAHIKFPGDSKKGVIFLDGIEFRVGFSAIE